jgi:hypothetical protein
MKKKQRKFSQYEELSMIGTHTPHKRIIVSEYFRGKLAPEIARECNHSIEACDRYITNAEQMKAALDHGMPEEEIPFVTGLVNKRVSQSDSGGKTKCY